MGVFAYKPKIHSSFVVELETTIQGMSDINLQYTTGRRYHPKVRKLQWHSWKAFIFPIKVNRDSGLDFQILGVILVV